MNRYASFAALALTLCLCACKQDSQSSGPKYSNTPVVHLIQSYNFAVHPLHNPAKMMQSYQPLIDYINSKLDGAQLTLEASRDYANFEEKYRSGKPELILPNPWQTLQAMKSGYSVIAMAGEPKDFKGVFIVRRDGGVRQPSDLKGKAVSYPAPTALAACIMPQFFLHGHGIDVNKDIDNRYVGSQESSIMNVYLKTTAVGATWPPPWRAFQKEHPKEASELKVIWETEPLVNNSVMVRSDIPKEIRDQLIGILTGLPLSKEGKAILSGIETARFIPAQDNDYNLVRTYVERFEREVRKVEQK